MADQFKITAAAATDIGLVRKENQDSYGILSQETLKTGLHLFIVADGLGGHNAGQVASQIAVESISQTFISNKETDDLQSLLKQAFEEANMAILEAASENPSYRGMGTTCTLLAIENDRAYIAHVGDSRAYRINQHVIEQLSKDHSHVAEMQRQGILTKEEAETHPDRSVLTRALGAKPGVEVDIEQDIRFRSEDYFLLCSDGLTTIDEKALKRIVLSHAPQEACDELIREANNQGGQDNATAIVIKVENPD